MRLAARRDANEDAIVDALLAAGCSVEYLNKRGVPDLLVARPDGVLRLLELKTDHGTLTPDQVRWQRAWGHPVAVVHSPDEALGAVWGD